MLRRANQLVERARERIRVAAEHDPHAWPGHDDDRAILVHDDHDDDHDDHDDHDGAGTAEPTVTAEPTGTGTGTGFAVDAEDGATPPTDAGDTSPPLGSPAPGAPDLDSP